MSAYYELSCHNEIQILQLKDLLSEYANKDVLKAAREKVKEGFKKFVVNLDAVQYMNSVGINLLIQLNKLAEGAGGKMVVVNPSPKIMQLLDITKLTPILNVFESLEEGMAKL